MTWRPFRVRTRMSAAAAPGQGIRAQAAPAEPAAGRGAALLLVHGIGEQERYASLDAFARGLVDAARTAAGSPATPDVHLEHRLRTVGGHVETAVHLQLEHTLPRSHERALDVYECYWAPLTERKIKLPRVLAWLARTSLTPLQHWATEPASASSAPGSVPPALLPKFLRLLLLPVLVGALAAPFAFVGGFTATLRDAGEALGERVPGGIGPAVDLFVPLVLAVFAAVAFVVSARTWWEGRRGAMDAPAAPRLARVALTAGVLCALTAGAVELIGRHRVVDYVGDVERGVFTWRLGLIAVAVVVAAKLRTFLVSTLGDVPLYVTADEKSDLYQSRAQILERSTALLWGLLEEYSAVVVAGHSLGSVIGYDSLNRLQQEVRAEQLLAGDRPRTTQLTRLHGFVTFGSPLDKIEYFFRTQVGPQQKVRAQILSSLHGWRRAATARVYDPYRFEPYGIPVPLDFWWANFWSRSDFVSNRLVRYQPNEQHSMGYFPWKAHSHYWHDPEFFERVYRLV